MAQRPRASGVQMGIYHSGNWTPPLQLPATQDLQGCGEILLATNTTAVRSEQNQLGGI